MEHEPRAAGFLIAGERMNTQGYDAEASTSQQLAEHIKSKLARFGKLIVDIGLEDQ